RITKMLVADLRPCAPGKGAVLARQSRSFLARPDNRLDHIRTRDALRIAVKNDLAIGKTDNAVGHSVDLIELMVNEQHADSAFACETPDDLEELVDLVLLQRCR